MLLSSASSLRRKLFYVPLALHLSLQGCAAAQLLAPATMPVMTRPAAGAHDVGSALVNHVQVIDTGLHGDRAITINLAEPVAAAEHAYKALGVMPTTQHRWVATDMVKYALSIRSSDDSYTAAIASADLNQKGASIATQATFTGLTSGKTYKIFLETYGNNGGTTLSTTLIDGQHPQVSSPISFTNTLGNDIQDSYTVTLAPTLNDTVFNGQIGVSIAAPVAGSYTSTLSATYSVVTTSAAPTVTLYSYFHSYPGSSTAATVSMSGSSVTVVEHVGISGTTTLVGTLSGSQATFPGSHTLTVVNQYTFVLDGMSFSADLG